MFKELVPYLRHRAVMMTVTHLEEDQIRVNVIPKKLKEGENEALTTPVSITGTAEELDQDLPSTLVSFVSAHLHSQNSLEKAKAEMDAASKTAQAEARSKAKAPAKQVTEKATATQATAVKPAESVKPETPRTPSLFEAEPPVIVDHLSSRDRDEEKDILAEINQQQQVDESDDLDEAA